MCCQLRTCRRRQSGGRARMMMASARQQRQLLRRRMMKRKKMMQAVIARVASCQMALIEIRRREIEGDYCSDYIDIINLNL
jgi:hypothetical protein